MEKVRCGSGGPVVDPTCGCGARRSRGWAREGARVVLVVPQVYASGESVFVLAPLWLVSALIKNGVLRFGWSVCFGAVIEVVSVQC